MPYDIFVSYCREDNRQGRISQLIDHLKKDYALNARRRLAVFFDEREIRGMQDWRQRILQALRESYLMIVCLSPSYLKSDYCQWEFIEYLKYEIGHLHGFNGVAPIYLVNVPNWDDKEFEKRCPVWVTELRRRQSFDLRLWYGEGDDALRNASVCECVTRLNDAIADTLLRGERSQNSLGNVDAHNPHFVGRTVNLRQLRANFVGPDHIGIITTVNGIGGLGKTALAIEYAHAFSDEYGGGRWQVRCAGKDDLCLALAELATSIGFEFTDDEKKQPELQFERTRLELKKLADAREPHRILLILDNVDRPSLLDPAQIARLNVGDWLHVIATSRLGENELHGRHRDRSFLCVDELPPDDALALIETYQPEGHLKDGAERDAAREIVRLLGCFTLAVESAAVYLGHFASDVTCSGFLARLKKEGLEGLDAAAGQSAEGIRHGEKRLNATLNPTLERLGDADKIALEFAALLPPDRVPLPWLRALVAKIFPEMAHEGQPGYVDPWINSLRRLFSLRLFQATDPSDEENEPRVVRIHRLVKALVQARLSRPKCELDAELVAVVVERSDALTKNWFDPKNKWEIAPLQSLLEEFPGGELRSAGDIAYNLGVVQLELGDIGNAEKSVRAARRVDNLTLPADHPSRGAALNLLGRILWARGKAEEAKSCMRQAIDLARNKTDEAKAGLPYRLNNLAQMLKESGELAEAEPLFREALALQEQTEGKDGPHVAECLNNLFGLALDAGRPDEAEVFLRRAVAIEEKILQPNHPNRALRLLNLSMLEKSKGRTVEASALSSCALQIAEKCFANDSGNLLTFLFASIDTARDPLAERDLRLRALTTCPFGSHERFEDTLGAWLANLQTLLESDIDVTTAQSVISRALEATRCPNLESAEVFLHCRACLAIVLIDLGRPTDAIEVLDRTTQAAVSRGYSLTLDYASGLATVAHRLRTVDKDSEAADVFYQVLAIQERHWGAQDPRLSSVLNNLGASLSDSNRLMEAAVALERAVPLAAAFAGNHSREYATTKENYMTLLDRLGGIKDLLLDGT